jgi:hypothetical protein
MVPVGVGAALLMRPIEGVAPVRPRRRALDTHFRVYNNFILLYCQRKPAITVTINPMNWLSSP